MEDERRVWNLFIGLILATDMRVHGAVLRLGEDIMSHDMTNGGFDHRSLLLKFVLKTGDISNVSRPSEIAAKWRAATC
jgi:hypothetical protein